MVEYQRQKKRSVWVIMRRIQISTFFKIKKKYYDTTIVNIIYIVYVCHKKKTINFSSHTAVRRAKLYTIPRCWEQKVEESLFVRSVMRHGAESERHHGPRAIWTREVIRSLIVGSNPTLTSGRSVSSVGQSNPFMDVSLVRILY